MIVQLRWATLRPVFAAIALLLACRGRAGADTIEGELLLRLPPSERGRSSLSTLRETLAGVAREVEVCNPGSDQPVVRVVLKPDVSVADARPRLERARRPIEVYSNVVYSLEQAPKDKHYSWQWPLDNTGQVIAPDHATPDVDINAPEAWAHIGEGAPKRTVAVAVIDRGVDYDHPDLMGATWVNEMDPINLVDDDCNGYVDDHHGLDAFAASQVPPPVQPAGDPKEVGNSHGTMVAGVIAARHNDELLAGIAPRAKVIICRAMGPNRSCTTCDALRCMDYIATLSETRPDLDIVATNNSWGTDEDDPLLAQAIAEHRDLGILYVASAGNDHFDTDLNPHFPSAFHRANVIAVAESDAHDRWGGESPWQGNLSNWGARTVHIAAPGRHVFVLEAPDFFTSAHGTSMAAAHVSGVLALMRTFDALRPGGEEWDWKDLRNLVLAGGRPLAAGKPTITNRRLLAWGPATAGSRMGALTCEGQAVRTRLRPIRSRSDSDPAKTEIVDLDASGLLEIAAIDIVCADPKTAVVPSLALEARVTNLCSTTVEPVAMLDDGQGFDEAAGDGIYSASWSPPPNWRAVEVELRETLPDGTVEPFDTFKVCSSQVVPACSCPDP